jgi:hypothetical protein
MEIKIAAADMYAVLVNAGIEANDAKAIIFDLMLAADGKFRPNPVATRPTPPPAQVQVRKELPPEPEPEAEAQDSDDPNQTLRQPSRIRRKVISFGGFGGPAEPLR